MDKDEYRKILARQTTNKLRAITNGSIRRNRLSANVIDLALERTRRRKNSNSNPA